MKKKEIYFGMGLILGIFAPVSLFAGALSLECSTAAARNGDGHSTAVIPPRCHSDVERAASPLTLRQRGNLRAQGAGGLLSFPASPKGFIAGDSTGLSQIQALAIDSEGRQVFVLNAGARPELLVFSAAAFGNLSPERRLVLREDFTPLSVAFSSQRHEVAIAGANEVRFFRLYSEKERARLQKDGEWVRTLNLSETEVSSVTDLCFDEVASELWVLDSGRSVVHVFANTASQRLRPLRTQPISRGRGVALNCEQSGASRVLLESLTNSQ